MLFNDPGRCGAAARRGDARLIASKASSRELDFQDLQEWQTGKRPPPDSETSNKSKESVDELRRGELGGIQALLGRSGLW